MKPAFFNSVHICDQNLHICMATKHIRWMWNILKSEDLDLTNQALKRWHIFLRNKRLKADTSWYYLKKISCWMLYQQRSGGCMKVFCACVTSSSWIREWIVESIDSKRRLRLPRGYERMGTDSLKKGHLPLNVKWK